MKICIHFFNMVQKSRLFTWIFLQKKRKFKKGRFSICILLDLNTKIYNTPVFYLVYLTITWNWQHWIPVSTVSLNAKWNGWKMSLLNNSCSSCWSVFGWKTERVFRENSDRSSLRAHTWFIILDLLLCEMWGKKKSLL